MNREEKEYLEDVTQQVKEIREVVDKDHALLTKQLKPIPSISQRNKPLRRKSEERPISKLNSRAFYYILSSVFDMSCFQKQ